MSAKSASQQQIEEREKRLDAMRNLAITVTDTEIRKLSPNLTHEQILEILKQKDIPIAAFLNEYMTLPSCFVKEATTKEYFNILMHKLNPVFVETKVGHFRLSDNILSHLINQIKQGKKP